MDYEEAVTETAARLAPGYQPEQAADICGTARGNPGVPVAFSTEAGVQSVTFTGTGYVIA